MTEVLQDFQRIGQKVALLGLNLNHHKTEVIFKESAGGQLLQVAPDLQGTCSPGITDWRVYFN